MSEPTGVSNANDTSKREYWTDHILERLEHWESAEGDTEWRKQSVAQLLPACAVESRRGALESWLVDSKRPWRARYNVVLALDRLGGLRDELQRQWVETIPEGRGSELFMHLENSETRSALARWLPLRLAWAVWWATGLDGEPLLRRDERHVVADRLRSISSTARDELGVGDRAGALAADATLCDLLRRFGNRDSPELRAALKRRPSIFKRGVETLQLPHAMLLEVAASPTELRERVIKSVGAQPKRKHAFGAPHVVALLRLLPDEIGALNECLRATPTRDYEQALLCRRVALSPAMDFDRHGLSLLSHVHRSLACAEWAATSDPRALRRRGLAALIDSYPMNVGDAQLLVASRSEDSMTRTLAWGELLSRGDPDAATEVRAIATTCPDPWVRARALCDIGRCGQPLAWRQEVLLAALETRELVEYFLMPVTSAAAHALGRHEDLEEATVLHALAHNMGVADASGAISDAFASWFGEVGDRAESFRRWCVAMHG